MKTLQNMLGKSPKNPQRDLFKTPLADIVNPKHKLAVLARNYPWEKLESEFAGLYSKTGTPSKPIRLMAGLLMLKQLENLSDERVVEAWVRDPYMQYFCGEQYFQWNFPCDPSDLVHFRHRIGEAGFELIFRLSVELHQDKFSSKDELLADTTVQEKNITFPTDTKLQLKIAAHVRRIGQTEDIKLRQSYIRVLQQLRQHIKFGHHPKRKKQARKARQKIKTIAGRLYRDLFSKLEAKGLLDKYLDILGAMGCVLEQQRYDKHKIYSLHEPQVSCIAKGKSHKPYEFGNKVSIAVHAKTNVIVGVASFAGNPYDGNTLAPTLEQVQHNTGLEFSKVIVDRGYKGINNVGQTQVIRPDNCKSKNQYEKRRKRKQLRRRAGIEPLISHVKHDHRMLTNFLKGATGDKTNALMACCAFNLRKWMMNLENNAFLTLKLLYFDFFSGLYWTLNKRVRSGYGFVKG